MYRNKKITKCTIINTSETKSYATVLQTFEENEKYEYCYKKYAIFMWMSFTEIFNIFSWKFII